MSTEQKSTFNNDNIKVEMRREPGCRILLEVNVSPDATQASYKKAVAAVKKEVSIPGFRKGKAPDDYVLKNFEKHVEREWKDILLNTTLSDSFQLTKVYPFNQNSVKAASIKNASKTDGALLTYEYEAAPVIPSINPGDITVPAVKAAEVKAKDIEEALEDLTLQSAEWSDVTDRPAEEGDFVVIDIDDIGETGSNICTDTLFSLSKGKMGDWMRRLIIGLTPGQHAEGMSEQDKHKDDCKECADGSHDHNHDFVPTKCRITLHKIRKASPHPVDDALAKKYGAPDAAELKSRIKQSLERKALEAQKDTQRRNVENSILQNYPFDMPISLVQGELKNVKKAIIDDLRRQGVAEADIPAEAKKIEEDAARRFERDFRLYFLTQKYAREHKIEVAKEEVAMEYLRQMWMQKMDNQQSMSAAETQERQAQLQMQMVTVKALDSIGEQAKKAPEKA